MNRFGWMAVAAVLTVLAACGGDRNSVAPRVATALRFISMPAFTPAGDAFTPTPIVEAIDANGARVPTYADTVTLTLDSAGAAVALGGTVGLPAVAGVAHFADLSVTRTGFLYTLIASAPGLVPDTTPQFTIIAAAGYRLLFVSEPGYASGGTPFVTQPSVVVLDSFSNQSPVTASVTLTLLGGPGALHGTRIVTATLGLAPFANLYVDSLGVGYRLLATAPGLLPDTSGAFTVF